MNDDQAAAINEAVNRRIAQMIGTMQMNALLAEERITALQTMLYERDRELEGLRKRNA